MTSAGLANKRGLTRFPLRSKIKITFLDGKSIFGECRNISGTGLLISSKESIPTDTEVHVEILEGRIDFNAVAKVVRALQQDGEQLFGLSII